MSELSKEDIALLIKEAGYKEPLEHKLLDSDNGCSTYQNTYSFKGKFYALQYHTSYISGWGEDSSDYQFIGEVFPQTTTTYVTQTTEAMPRNGE